MHDPGNAHGVIYMWGTNGIGYNEKMIKALLPKAPLDSWRMVFDPAVASKVAKCGISVLDSPAEMMRAVYSYLGKDPNSQNPDDLVKAEAVLTKIRPYIRNINSSEYIEALANGDICLAVGYNGDVLQARDRAREAGKGIEIKYAVPKEGSILWFDMLAIPKDAPNPESAYAFINYILTPRVIADISNFKRYANADAQAQSLLDPSVRDDPAIYPPKEQRKSWRCNWRIRPTRPAPSPASGKNSRRANKRWRHPAERPSKRRLGRIRLPGPMCRWTASPNRSAISRRSMTSA